MARSPPLDLSSDALTSIPAPSHPIKPGETMRLKVPLVEFFGRSKFDPGAEKYRVRMTSYLYLDANLTQWIEARSNWVELKL